MNEIQWTKIKHDVNGNPRYVCHFLALCNDDEQADYTDRGRYARACKRANTIGGRKFHNKQYGGGIVFQSYSLKETEAAIKRVLGGVR